MPAPSMWYEPFQESLSRLTVDSKSMSELLAFFSMPHKSVKWVLNNVPLWLASPFWDSSALHSWKPRQQSFGSFSRDCSQPFSHEQAAGHACRYGFSFFWWSLVPREQEESRYRERSQSRPDPKGKGKAAQPRYTEQEKGTYKEKGKSKGQSYGNYDGKSSWNYSSTSGSI